MSCAVLVLEQPWWDLDDDPDQTSARHFLDGLSRLDGLPTFYATFYDATSFGQALKYLVDARKLDFVDKLIVYVASHGAVSRIGNGNATTMNLRTMFDRIQDYGKGKVVGLILDSCEVGAQHHTIKLGMEQARIRWLVGYGASVDWLTSTLINLHVLSVMAELDSNDLKSRTGLIAAIQRALSIFNPFLNIDADEEDDVESDDSPLILSEILTICIRSSRRDPMILSPDDIWPELEAIEA